MDNLEKLEKFLFNGPLYVFFLFVLCVILPIISILLFLFLKVIATFGLYGLFTMWAAGISVIGFHIWRRCKKAAPEGTAYPIARTLSVD